MPPDAAARRLEQLRQRYRLSAGQRYQLATLLDLIAGDPAAPTTVRAAEDAVDVHVADSLVATTLEPLRGAGEVADLGAGAGLPGLVIAVALPAASVALVESNRRKCAFLERAITALALEKARVVCARAEEWRDGLERCDAVLARALAPQPVVLEYAAPLLQLGGVLVDWRGRRNANEEAAAAAAADLLGLSRPEILPVEPFAGAHHRHLQLFTKVAATPSRFPRRPGAARKRPLPR
jgi:16S rRNA (guanine527-N7)-methyltransferase